MGLPLGGDLLLAESLIIVALLCKELLEVRLAVDNALHGSIVAKGDNDIAVGTLEACLVEDLLALLLLNHSLLSGIHCLVASMALLSVQGGLLEFRGCTPVRSVRSM